MSGSICVDFAGTHAEAVAYCKEHEPQFPDKFTCPKWAKPGSKIGNANELPMVYARFRNEAERVKVQDAFADLGWDTASQITNSH